MRAPALVLLGGLCAGAACLAVQEASPSAATPRAVAREECPTEREGLPLIGFARERAEHASRDPWVGMWTFLEPLPSLHLPPPPLPPLERPDPVEHGPCTLELRLVDDMPEAAPVRTVVRLWRLNAPGNDDWSEGDQLQDWTLTRSNGAVRFTDLPRGTYRAEVVQRAGSEDPPAFEVQATLEERTLVVRAVRRHRAWVRVIDGEGREIREGVVSYGPTLPEEEEVQVVPVWCHPRRTPDGLATPARVRTQALNRSLEPERERPEGAWEAGDHGFEFGFHEATTHGGETSCYSIQTRDFGEVDFFIGGGEAGPPGDRHYVVAMVPAESLTRNVVLPDGRRAQDAGAEVFVQFDALRVLPDMAPDAWRRTAIFVKVELAGFDVLKLETDLDGPPPRWTLTAGDPERGPRHYLEVRTHAERRGDPAR